MFACPICPQSLDFGIPLAGVQVEEQRGKNPEKRSGHEDEKVRLENEKTVTFPPNR
jgi:hypothetical protein